MEILAGSDMVLLESQEIANAHMRGVTKTCVTQMLMMIKRCNLEHLLTKDIACTCYMHITVQLSVDVQQEQP